MTAVLVLVNPSAASASTWSYTLIETSVPTDGIAVPLVALPALSLSAGDNKFLNAKYTASNSDAFNIMQGARIRCRRMSDDALFYSVYSTRNIIARSASTLQVHWMFTAPSTADYACTLWGHAATSVGTNYDLTVTAGQLGVDDSAFPGGTEWRDTLGGQVAPGQSIHTLRKTWTSVTGGTIGVNVGVELTNNYTNNYGAGAVADVDLIITQLNAAGSGCAPPFGSATRISISTNVHHDKVNLDSRGHAISTAAGCTPSFAIKVLVTSIAGNPVVLEGNSGIQYSNGIAFSS